MNYDIERHKEACARLLCEMYGQYLTKAGQQGTAEDWTADADYLFDRIGILDLVGEMTR